MRWSHATREGGKRWRSRVFYRQCRLVKRFDGGELQLVSWIPEPYATAGRVVKLREDGAWDDGWVVVGAGTNRLPAAEVPDFHTN